MTEPSKEELMARIAELEKQVGSKKQGSLEFKVSEKGSVSVYGLGRFPVTLYYDQWVRLLDSADGLRTFLEENKSKLIEKQSVNQKPPLRDVQRALSPRPASCNSPPY
jgi:hypothetical protein